MRCPSCKAENPEGAKFCVQCARALKRQCTKCGSENPPDARFCAQCAISLTEGRPSNPVAAPTSSGFHATVNSAEREAIDGERKTVTALFADIKGSTELMEDLDPEEARAIIDPALKLMIDAVRRYDGYVVQSTGDGIFALFGAPVAHEDHPQRALYAALRIQEELKRYSGRLREAGNLPIEGRVGVNTGEVVVRSITTGASQVEYTPIGHTTNLASRMQALAPTGSIAASEQTRKLVEGYFALRPLGPTRIKGVSEPVNVYEVTGLGPLRTRLQRSAGRGFTKFVGREREMEAMTHAAEQAKSGHGQIVAAMAEPGVGKSRLFFELTATSQAGWMVLETFSVSHGKASAYLPVIDLLRNYFKITVEDDQRTRREKLTGRILALDRNLEDTLQYLFALLGIVEGDDPLAQMDGQIKKRRTLEAIKRIALRESLNQPLIVIFEDLHWIDEQTQELLNLLADSIGTAKILLLVNYRPEYTHLWNSKTYYTQLRLDPLGKESAEEMLSTLLGDGKELIPLKRLIIELTEGTPYFMEEIVQSLFEDGVLQRNAAVKLVKPMNAVKVPATVQGVIAARIDRLPAEQKELLQTLAVLGREFPFGLVRRVTLKLDDDLNRMLNELQLAEFIYEQPATGDVEYIFKHALTQEVAYNSILLERRKPMHERAGQALESVFAEQLEDHLDELAHHFTQSANAGRAVRYLTLAGKQSFERGAYVESQAQFQHGLNLVRSIPEDTERSKLELELLLGSEETLRYARGIGFVGDVIGRAEELSELVGTDAQRFSVLIGMRDVLVSSGDEELAIEKCRLALGLAERTHDPEMVLIASGFMGLTLMQAGRPGEALPLARRALNLTQDVERPRGFISLRAGWIARAVIANSLLLLGYPEQAEKAAREALASSRQMTLPAALVAGQAIVSVYLNLRMPKVAREFAEEGVASAERSGFAFVRELWAARLGSAIALDGHPEEGIVMIQDAVSSMAGVPGYIRGLVASLIEALIIAGRYNEANVKAEVLLSYRPTHQFAAVAHYLKGEATLRRQTSAIGEAEACFRKSIGIARVQEAKWWELRATTSLARLLAEQGKPDEARSMLAEIYNWFTEGFDTADLKDAKALLEELGG